MRPKALTTARASSDNQESDVLIRDLFAKNPCRQIKPIIQAGERAPEVLGLELDEYVVTPEIETHLRLVLDEFIESRPGRRPSSVCVWVSGWFGSGKSHFLKFLGALLADPQIQLPNGSEVAATPYLCQRWNLPFEHLLLELQTRVVPINLLNYVSGVVPGLSEIIYRGLMEHAGFADEPWVAEMERLLAGRGLYDRFREKVEAESGMPWEQVRAQPIAALPIMAKALVTVDPDTWPTIELAERAIDRQERITLNPSTIGRRLREEARAINPDRGRLVVLLDEVGLYVGEFEDRYKELKAIAEAVSRDEGYGSVWLIVTSQEAPEEKIPAIRAHQEELEWLRDRFPVKLALTPENIETVVRERLLKKSDAGRDMVVEQSRTALGAIATGASMRGVRRRRDVFEPPDAQSLAATYPLLPYQVRLTTEVVGELRARGPGAEGLTGRERAVLSIAQSAVCGGDRGLASEEVGPIVTLAHIYDAIVGDTRLVPGARDAEIRELADLGTRGGVQVQSVAKALYLLQHVPAWVPATAENIAAGLYPQLGARGDDVVAGVRSGVAELLAGNYIGEQEGNYRFLSEEERTFEQDVQRAQRNIGARREREANKLLKEILDGLAKLRFESGIRTFDVAVDADGTPITTTGYLRLVVQSSFEEAAADADELERAVSPAARDTVWLLTEPSADVRSLLDRAIGMEEALSMSEVVSREGQQFRRERERELETLRHVTLPTRLREAFARATLVAVGTRQGLAGSDWEQSLRAALEDRARDVFYDFSPAASALRDEDVIRILTWQGGVLPECYRTLRVVEGERIRENSPLLSKVLDQVKERARTHAPSTGQELQKCFDEPPYGWDERAVRLALAALFRNGSLEIHTAHGIFRSYRDANAARALTNRSAFKEASFHPAVVIGELERREAANLAANWFGRVTADTPEQIDDAMRAGLDAAAADATQLATRLADFRLSGARALEDFASEARAALDLSTPAARLLAIIEPERRGRLSAGLALLESVRNLSDAGNLERTVEIREFVGILESLDAERATQLRRLLDADDLAGAWRDLYDDYRAAVNEYSAAFAKQHSDLRNRVDAAVRELQAHPAASRIADGISALACLSCAEPAPQVDRSPFRCAVCRRALGDVERDRLAVDADRNRLLTEAETPETRGGEAPQPLELAITITRPDELARATARLAAYVNATLDRGAVHIEIRARSGED
jgi:hypothetical protein